jgi:hypothetical protein
VAIISTPRSGNTWLLHLLSNIYQAATQAVHSPLEINWDKLPASCILQVHWHPEPSFLLHLEKAEFRVVVVARHPLDVLISILHFALYDPTCRWLEGEGGNERPIFGAMPRSTAFLDYATGPRANALLSISQEWWSRPGCQTLHYEDLVAQPVDEMVRLVAALGTPPLKPVESAVEATTLAKLRKLTQNTNHFWQGQANLWKKFFTASEAASIAAIHASLFGQLGYRCEPDSELTAGAADANWLKLVWAPLTEELHDLRQFKDRTNMLEKQLSDRTQELNACRADLGRMHCAYSRLEAQQASLREEHSWVSAQLRTLANAWGKTLLGWLLTIHPAAACAKQAWSPKE